MPSPFLLFCQEGKLRRGSGLPWRVFEAAIAIAHETSVTRGLWQHNTRESEVTTDPRSRPLTTCCSIVLDDI